jgi:hypothetical protein
MPAAAGHLQGRGNAIEFQLALELAKVEEGVVIISVNGDPFTTLRLRVDGVERPMVIQPARCLRIVDGSSSNGWPLSLFLGW